MAPWWGDRTLLGAAVFPIEDQMSSGYLYILINPTIPGLSKVGKTTREPADRSAELSGATGVASPFILAYQQPVADCDFAEAWIHDALTERGWRHANNREFFSAPLHEIVALMAQCSSIEPSIPKEKIIAASGIDEHHEEATDEGDRLALLAYQTLLGSGGGFADRPRGAKIMQQAADLGSILACKTAGELLMEGENGIPKDLPKAFGYLVRAADGGLVECRALLAQLLMVNGQREAAQKRWEQYFFITALLLTRTVEQSDLQNVRAHAGKHGRKYCNLAYMKRVDDLIDDACFHVLVPYIESAYAEERTRALGFPPIVHRKMLIELDLEERFLHEKRARGALLPPWKVPER